eukprot:6227996-Heterocapsa_arctica.AAC.1
MSEVLHTLQSKLCTHLFAAARATCSDTGSRLSRGIAETTQQSINNQSTIDHKSRSTIDQQPNQHR